MADSINSTQQTSSTGSNTGYFRDVNASASLGEFLNNFNASTSSATSGNITVGDKIIGGQKSAQAQFSILKILVIVAGAGILLKLYQEGAK